MVKAMKQKPKVISIERICAAELYPLNGGRSRTQMLGTIEEINIESKFTPLLSERDLSAFEITSTEVVKLSNGREYRGETEHIITVFNRDVVLTGTLTQAEIYAGDITDLRLRADALATVHALREVGAKHAAFGADHVWGFRKGIDMIFSFDTSPQSALLRTHRVLLREEAFVRYILPRLADRGR